MANTLISMKEVTASLKKELDKLSFGYQELFFYKLSLSNGFPRDFGEEERIKALIAEEKSK